MLNGRPGQIKKVTVPDIDGANDYWVEFKYGDNGKIRETPTQVLYPHWDAATSQYVTKTDTISYDDIGRVTGTTDANERIIGFLYDEAGRPSKTVFGTGVETEVAYNCCGVDWAADEKDRTVNFGFDSAQRLVKAWISGTGQSANNPLIDGTYDAFGNIESDRTHPSASKIHQMVYGYNKNNRLTSVCYPLGLIGQEQVGYDSVGNLLWYRQDNKDETWSTTLYHYDGLHRLDGVYYEDDYTGPFPPVDGVPFPDGIYDGLTPDVTITYEGWSGLVSEIEDAVGTSSFTYDEFGRLETYSQPNGPTLTYTYNNLGQKTSISSTSG